MKKIAILVLFFVFSLQSNLIAQIKSNVCTAKLDTDSSLISHKGDLLRLVNNIYQAFNIYCDGKINTELRFRLPPIILDSEEKTNFLEEDDLRKISIDEIEALNIIYGNKTEAIAFGVRGLSGIIKIKLRDESILEK